MLESQKELSSQPILSLPENITERQYSLLQKAFEFFNEKLFDSELPNVLITLNRRNKTAGYFRYGGMFFKDNGEDLGEIALNPDTFTKGTGVEKILSTLVHEQ